MNSNEVKQRVQLDDEALGSVTGGMESQPVQPMPSAGFGGIPGPESVFPGAVTQANSSVEGMLPADPENSGVPVPGPIRSPKQ